MRCIITEGILLNDPNRAGGLTANKPKFHDITLYISLSGIVLVLIHLAMLGVLVINSTCKDQRNSGNHDIIQDGEKSCPIRSDAYFHRPSIYPI